MITTYTVSSVRSLRIISVTSLIVLSIIIAWNLGMYYLEKDKENIQHARWFLHLVYLQIPRIAGVLLIYVLRRSGLWMYVASTLFYFCFPFILGSADTVFGLLTLPYFIEAATFSLLFIMRRELFLK